MRSAALLMILGLIGGVECTKWALVVAGSNGWGNYRHQADACHAYHVLRNHGIAPENIVTMMYDDIANNTANIYPGKIYNEPEGPDVYQGVVKDYTGDDVNPANFLAILQGQPITVGSGKTIESGPDDHIFVFFTDHGATGLIAFPNDFLHMADLNNALVSMHAKKRFGRLVFYLEACESGSMFRNVLPTNIDVYAMTASSYDESSWGCYCDNDMQLPCLGDLFSVVWMGDSDKEDLTTETVGGQLAIVTRLTNQSHVQAYGDTTIEQEPVSDFQGDQESTNRRAHSRPITGVVKATDIPMYQLKRQYSWAKTKKDKNRVRKQMNQIKEGRRLIDKTMSNIAKSLLLNGHIVDEEQFVERNESNGAFDTECHKILVQTFHQNCFNVAKNGYAMQHMYKLGNACSADREDINLVGIVQLIKAQCDCDYGKGLSGIE